MSSRSNAGQQMFEAINCRLAAHGVPVEREPDEPGMVYTGPGDLDLDRMPDVPWSIPFDEVAGLEPRLWDLLADAEQARRRRARGWCPVACYYQEFAGRISRLVGWVRLPREFDGSAREWTLRSSQAYDRVCAHVVNTLHGAIVMPDVPVERADDDDDEDWPDV